MDDMDDTTAGPGDALGGDLLVDDPTVLDFLHRLRDAGQGPVPEVGDELAAVLAAAASPAVPLRAVDPGRRGPGRRGIAGVAVLGFMTAGVGAAAADGLPRPVQRVVSEVVSRWTPFDLPHPDASTPPGAVPTPSSIPTPTETEDAADEPQQVPVAPVGTDPGRPARQDGPRDEPDADDDGGSGTDDHGDGDGGTGDGGVTPTSRPTSGGDDDPGSEEDGGGSDDGDGGDDSDGGEDRSGDGDGGDGSGGDSSGHGGSSGEDSGSRSGSSDQD